MRTGAGDPAGRAAARLLLACVRRQDWSSPPPGLRAMPDDTVLERLLELATAHRAVGFVHESLRHLAARPSPGWTAFQAQHRYMLVSGLAVQSSARRVAAALDPTGIRWLVVKGPVLDHTVYPRPGLRSYVDLDVVVAGPSYRAGLAALRETGWEHLDANWILLHERMASELQLGRPGGATVDYHWQLVFGRELREVFRLPVPEMVARSRRVVLPSGEVSTFEPADALVHLALHAAMDGGDRLVWLKDVDMVVRHCSPDWDDVTTRARAWGARLPVALVLGRARRVLGAPVPRAVLARLAPERTWRGLTAVVDTAFPPQRTGPWGSPASLLARASREDVPGSLREAASGLVARARHASVHGGASRPGTRADPGSSGSLDHLAGGEREREAFLARVEADG